MSNDDQIQTPKGGWPKKTREDSGFSSKSSSQLSPTAADFHFAHFDQTNTSDSGTSFLTEQELFNGMKEEVGQVHDHNGQQLPGSWYYENGVEDGSLSPNDEFEAEAQSKFLASLRNITQAVDVPSSEHVAEIVGRQGCKIKALRAKTNTYIKTPVRGEDPVFTITGRPEDVAEAKREVECAAEHFTQIRASRRHSQGGAPAPGHVTVYVRVPLRVVGLVVGPKGATIKRIQQDTHTYIITPSREREPIFEVTGLPHNVAKARKEIEEHIFQRTGNMPMTDPSSSISTYTEMQANIRKTVGSNNGPANDQYAMASMMKNFPSMRTGYAPTSGGFGGNLMMNGSFQSFTPSPVSFQTSPNSVNSNRATQEDSFEHAGYQPWSTNGFGGVFETADLFSSSRSQLPACGGNSSVWPSSIGMSADRLAGCASQDDRLTESPTNSLLTMGGSSFGTLQTIWSDATSDGKNSTNIPLLSV